MVMRAIKQITKLSVAALCLIVTHPDTSFGHGDDGGHEIAQPILKKGKRPSKFWGSVGLSYSSNVSENKRDEVEADQTGVSASAHAEDEEEHGHDHRKNHGIGSPSLSLQLGYRFYPKWDLSFSGGGNSKDGVEDPALAIGFQTPISRRFTARSALALAAPVSKESSEAKLISSIKPSAGLNFRLKRWIVSSNVSGTFNQYGKTEAAKEDADHASTEAEEHGEEHEGESHDNELARYAGSTGLTYRLTRSFSLGAGYELSRAFWQVDQPTWASNATLARAALQVENFATALSFALRSEAHELLAPSEPIIRVGADMSF